MPTNQNSLSPQLEKRYITPVDFERLYSVGRRKLRTLRRLGGGPKFRRVSAKVILYEIAEVERWLRSLSN
jgi:hypothetical protein